jgi:hypothetical protein
MEVENSFHFANSFFIYTQYISNIILYSIVIITDSRSYRIDAYKFGLYL